MTRKRGSARRPRKRPERIAAGAPRRRRTPPPRSPRARRSFPPPPVRWPPPPPSAPRASAPCARRRRSCGGSRTSGRPCSQQRERIDAEHGGDADLNAAAAPPPKPKRSLAQREKEAEAAEAALAAARGSERRARGPYEAAERRLAALEAEARTLTKLLDRGAHRPLRAADRFPRGDGRLREGACRRARRRPRRVARFRRAGLLGAEPVRRKRSGAAGGGGTARRLRPRAGAP